MCSISLYIVHVCVHKPISGLVYLLAPRLDYGLASSHYRKSTKKERNVYNIIVYESICNRLEM